MERNQLNAGEKFALDAAGINIWGAELVLADSDPWKTNFGLAMDAQPRSPCAWG